MKQAEQPREIAGLVVERRMLAGAGFEGADAEQVVLQETVDHCWRFRLYGTVLQNEFAGVTVGDVVAVRYDGWVTKPGVGPDGRPKGYHGYSVTVDQGTDQSRAAAAQTAPPTQPPPPGSEQQVEPEPELPASSVLPCEACGMLNGHHAKSCPFGDDDIPF